MAESTRAKTTLQDLEKALSQKIATAAAEANQRYAESQAQLQTLATAILEIQKVLQTPHGEPSNGSNYRRPHVDGERGSSPQPEGNHSSYATRLSKVGFPRFDGSQLKEWLYRCEQFFAIDNTPPEGKVRIASMHFSGLALQWHLNYMKTRLQDFPSWPQYVSDLGLRFGEVYADPLADLINVKQKGRV